MRTRPCAGPGSPTPGPANRRWTRRLRRRSTGGRQPSGEFGPRPRGSCCAGRGKRRGGARTQETKPRGPAQHGRGGHCRCEPAGWARNPTGRGAGPDAESCGVWSAGPMSAGHLGARVAHRSGSQGCGASGPRGGVRVATVPRIAPGSGACVGMLHPAGVPSGTPFPAAPGFDFAASRSSPRAALIPGASATLQEVQPQARGTPGPGSVGRGLKPREGSSARLIVDGTARPGLHLGILRCH